MKTLTKILSVTALIVLCVCLFTLTAFADTAKVVKVYTAETASCTTLTNGRNEGVTLSNGVTYYGLHGMTAADENVTEIDSTDYELWTPVPGGASGLMIPYQHTLTSTTTAGDCKNEGTQCYNCSVCSRNFKDAAGTIEGVNSIGYGPHTPVGPVGPSQPDCMTSGSIEYYICSVCKKPCNSNGTITYNPSDIYLPADPALHQWGDWEILKPATDVSPGQKMRTCKICAKKEYEEIPALGIFPKDGGQDIDYVIPIHDTWMRGEEPLTFESSLVKRLNDASGPNANWVGVRVGTDSLYENSWDTFDFWSWDEYVKLGDKTMAGLREGKYRLWIYDKRHPDQYTCSCEFWVVDVPTLEPYNTDKHVVNSSKSLRFVASEEIQPTSVMVGSRKLYDANDFFVSNDRKSITLSPDFLNARQTGTYTISARTKGGETIKTNFYILSTAQASSSPRTGDESQIGLWAAFLLLSGAAIVVMVPKLRKHGAK